jgi:malonyl-CoA O-methyltransferase
VERKYEALRRDGMLPATFEVVYGHAWAPISAPDRTAEGHAVIRLHRRAER